MEEFHGNIININKNNVAIVGLEEFVKTSNDKPILATNSIHNCFVILIELPEAAYMAHLENDANSIDINKIKQFIQKVDTKIINKILFYGGKTSSDIYNSIANNLGIKNIYKSYIDLNIGSIAYDFSNKKYYGIDSDMNFREYKLGFNNFRKYQIHSDKTL